MINLMMQKKHLTKFNYSFMINTQKNGYTENMPQHNKGHI